MADGHRDVKRRGLLVDYGGVLTNDLFRVFGAFCSAEGLDPQALRAAFADDAEAARLLVEFECGRLEESQFEHELARRLGIDGERLIDRMFAGMSPEPTMLDAVAAARRAGVRTGLLSNSWGHRYDRTRWDELFDVTVISGEIGLRKPQSAIYTLAAERLGLHAQEIVFVDDIPHNLPPAERLGMATVHHTGVDSTIGRLEELLGVRLRAQQGL